MMEMNFTKVSTVRHADSDIRRITIGNEVIWRKAWSVTITNSGFEARGKFRIRKHPYIVESEIKLLKKIVIAQKSAYVIFNSVPESIGGYYIVDDYVISPNFPNDLTIEGVYVFSY